MLSNKGPKPVEQNVRPFGLAINPQAIEGVYNIIVIASGKGGVGKSTVASNLAAALALKHKKVGLLDADIYGPSIPIMYGVDGVLEISPSQRIIPKEKFGVKLVSFGFLTDRYSPVIWRGPMVSKAFRQLCYDVEWEKLDYLVIDLPPGTGDIQLTLVEQIPVTGAIIVSTPQDVALIDAEKAISMFEKLAVPIIGVVENMAYYQCPHCNQQEQIFGDHFSAVVARRNIKPLAKIPLLKDIRFNCDQGIPFVCQNDSMITQEFFKITEEIFNRYELTSAR